MPEKGNNHSGLQFTDRDKKIIDYIVITIAIIVDHIITDYKNPKDIMDDYHRITSSRAKVTQAFTTLILLNINNDTGVSLQK
jgi:hypothetical protein